MYKYLCETKKEYILSKQVLRSGTSIGANIAEAFYAESDMDFIHKLSISRKENSETLYWLLLLYQGGYLDEQEYESINAEGDELIRMLTTSIKR